MGVAFIKHDQEITTEEVAAKADAVLYKVKENGKDGIIFA